MGQAVLLVLSGIGGRVQLTDNRKTRGHQGEAIESCAWTRQAGQA